MSARTPSTAPRLALVCGALPALFALLLSSGEARAQYRPGGQPAAGQPGYTPVGPGNKPSQPYTQPPAAGGSGTEQQLRNAEKQDSGRGLEWFYVGAEGGAWWIGADALSKGDAPLLLGGRKSSAFAPGGGLFLGGRFFVLTAGARVRTAWASDFHYLSVGPEVGLHIPSGNFEPLFSLGGGYVTLIGVGDQQIRGFNVRLSGGFDQYLSNNFSIGALASVELLRLTRAAVGGSSDPDAAREGSSLGLSAGATLVVGLHF